MLEVHILVCGRGVAPKEGYWYSMWAKYWYPQLLKLLFGSEYYIRNFKSQYPTKPSHTFMFKIFFFLYFRSQILVWDNNICFFFWQVNQRFPPPCFFFYLNTHTLVGSKRHIYTWTKPYESWEGLDKGSRYLNQSSRAWNGIKGEPSDWAKVFGHCPGLRRRPDQSDLDELRK